MRAEAAARRGALGPRRVEEPCRGSDGAVTGTMNSIASIMIDGQTKEFGISPFWRA